MRMNQIIKGSICVKVQGGQRGRFLTVLAARGIWYENVKYEEDTMVLEMPANRFREAVICGKKTGMKLKIISKKGIPFFLFRHRRKKWLLALLLPMIFSICYFPGFIWSIEIHGIKNISEIEMLTRLEEIGIGEGMRKKTLELEEAKNQLLLKYDDLSFVSFAVEGTSLRLTAEERIEPPMMVERSTASDLEAVDTCIIYSIVTEQGTPLVRAGDVVKAGDILIRGEVVQKNDEGIESSIETHASGEVYGKVVWQGEAKIEKKYMEKVYFSKVKRGFCIRIGSWNLELRWPWGIEENESSIEEEIWRSPAGGKVSVSQMMYEGYECQESEYTEGEMEEKLRDGLKRKLESEIQDEDIVILKEEFKVEKIKEGMKATLEVEMMKNIGISVESKTRTGEE